MHVEGEDSVWTVLIEDIVVHIEMWRVVDASSTYPKVVLERWMCFFACEYFSRKIDAVEFLKL